MPSYILLPTRKFPKVGQLNLVPHNRPGHRLERIHYVTTGAGLEPQHLHQVISAPIQVGDYYLLDMNAGSGERDWELLQSNDAEDAQRATSHPMLSTVKVVATTDPALGLPLLSEQRVTDYLTNYNRLDS